jgi:hypothetical protein
MGKTEGQHVGAMYISVEVNLAVQFCNCEVVLVELFNETSAIDDDCVEPLKPIEVCEVGEA